LAGHETPAAAILRGFSRGVRPPGFAGFELSRRSSIHRNIHASSRANARSGPR
jgi:hypothetical protein